MQKFRKQNLTQLRNFNRGKPTCLTRKIEENCKSTVHRELKIREQEFNDMKHLESEIYKLQTGRNYLNELGKEIILKKDRINSEIKNKLGGA